MAPPVSNALPVPKQDPLHCNQHGYRLTKPWLPIIPTDSNRDRMLKAE